MKVTHSILGHQDAMEHHLPEIAWVLEPADEMKTEHMHAHTTGATTLQVIRQQPEAYKKRMAPGGAPAETHTDDNNLQD